MTENILSSATATGEEIFEVVSRLEPELIGLPRGHAVIALLSIVITVMNPDISAAKLKQLVQDTSEFICLGLEMSPGEDPNRKVTLN